MQVPRDEFRNVRIRPSSGLPHWDIRATAGPCSHTVLEMLISDMISCCAVVSCCPVVVCHLYGSNRPSYLLSDACTEQHLFQAPNTLGPTEHAAGAVCARCL